MSIQHEHVVRREDRVRGFSCSLRLKGVPRQVRPENHVA